MTFQLEFVPLMQRETYAYLWKEHPFADRGEISLEELKDYPCIVFVRVMTVIFISPRKRCRTMILKK